MRLLATLLLVLAAAGCNKDDESSDPGTTSGNTTHTNATTTTTGAGDPVLLGSCTGQPDTTGTYTCMTEWQVPVEGVDLVVIFQSTCANAAGTYSSGECGPGTPGCCTITPENPEDPIVEYCYHVTDGDPDNLLRQQCDGFGGSWE
jgi:hypothetical protein